MQGNAAGPRPHADSLSVSGAFSPTYREVRSAAVSRFASLNAIGGSDTCSDKPAIFPPNPPQLAEGHEGHESGTSQRCQRRRAPASHRENKDSAPPHQFLASGPRSAGLNSTKLEEVPSCDLWASNSGRGPQDFFSLNTPFLRPQGQAVTRLNTWRIVFQDTKHFLSVILGFQRPVLVLRKTQSSSLMRTKRWSNLASGKTWFER